VGERQASRRSGRSHRPNPAGPHCRRHGGNGTRSAQPRRLVHGRRPLRHPLIRSAIGDEQAARVATPSMAQRANGRNVANNLRDESRHRAGQVPAAKYRKISLGRHARVRPPSRLWPTKKARAGGQRGQSCCSRKPAGMPERLWCAGRRVAFNLILGNASRYLSLCSSRRPKFLAWPRSPRAQCALPRRSGAAGAMMIDAAGVMRLEPPPEVTRSECSCRRARQAARLPALRIEPHNRVAR
jgi:hypothetical protein